MQRSDLLLGEFESVRSVYHWDDGELVRLAGNGAGPLLAYVPASEQASRDVLETMALVACPGVPVCRRTIRAGSGATALVLEGAEDARPLALVHDLPAATLRSGLTALLRALNHVHSRGIVHRSIDRSTVLADPSGRFWLIGWGSARPVSEAHRPAGSLTEATADLRDLACAFREALLRRPWPDPQAATIHERRPRTHAGQDLIDVGVKVDRDFARVLSRLVGCDPRETYSGATDVLVDLSVEDATAFDPWESLPLVGMRREVARVLRLLDDTQRATSESVVHAASVDYVGPSGAGKSRVLAEIARAARSRDVIVLTAEGGARGTWGGVGALARQLVQLLGRDARMCRQHEDALRHLLDDRDPSARPQPQLAPGLGLEGRNTLTSSCTAALTDMVRIAFRATPGLLLLDDEENLPAAARDVWRASGQFVQAINGAGGVLRALLVSASTHSYPAEIGAHRVTVELRTWRQRDLEKFLAQVFASPGGTRDVSVAIHRITGGRPGDVIAYLRDLESRGALRREGLRWRLDVPLASLPALTGGVAEQVRRALDSCGRDATSLAEVLAVASDVTLGRSAVAEISDVRGPRLASAAEAAIAAGLVIPDGSAWRVRTDAIAHKLLATIPDDRRKVLHREVLQHLLDTTPDAIDPIAHHARASADPRAPAWTDQAIARARSEGNPTRALCHAEEAAHAFGRHDAGSALERADLLAVLGRPGAVIRLLDSSALAPHCPPEQALKVALAIAQAHYDAREWRELMSRGVPETASSPAIVSEIRFLRAAALCHLSMREMAFREARLASAETMGPIPPQVTLARLEFEYQAALYSSDKNRARRALMGKIRASRKARDSRQMVIDLTKLGNATRFLDREYELSHAILIRAVAHFRYNGASSIGGTALSSLYAAMAYVCIARGAGRRACRHFDRSAFYAAQTGVAGLVVAARLRQISCAAESGRATYDDKRYVGGLVRAAVEVNSQSLLSACIDFGVCLLYFGHQVHLEQLAAELMANMGNDHRASVINGLSVVGQMWLLGPPSDNFARITSDRDARGLTKWLARCRLGDLWLSGLVYCAMDPRYTLDDWTRSLLRSNRLSRIVMRRPSPGWGIAAAALGLALWIPVEYDSKLWERLLQVVRSSNGTLPVGLEWQRVLMESREAMRVGQFRVAQSLRDTALDQLELLAECGDRDRGRAAVDQWKAMIALTSSASVAEDNDPDAAVCIDHRDPDFVAPDIIQRCLEHWKGTLNVIVGARRSIVSSPSARELMLFAEALLVKSAGAAYRVEPASLRRLRHDSELSLGIMLSPETWTASEARAVATYVDGRCSRASKTAVLSTLDVVGLRALSSGHAALVEASDGCLVRLSPLLHRPKERRELFSSACRRSHADAVPTCDVLDEVERYHWPGGLAELETVADAASAIASGVLDRDALLATGWESRVAAAALGQCVGDGALVAEVRTNGPATLGELAARLGRAKRTLLRHATRLVDSGYLVRTGRGRATRYRSSEREMRQSAIAPPPVRSL